MGAHVGESFLRAPVLKPFDLKAGDLVRYKANVSPAGNPRFSVFDDPTYNIWRVTSISKHLFVAENKYGIRTAFRKDEYRIGEVAKVD